MDTQACNRLVLVYHKIDPRPDFGLSTIHPEILDSHLQFLSEQGFRFVTLSGLKETPSRACAIVWDDAYAGVTQYALPIMRKHSCPGTTAIIANYVGADNTWDVPIGRRFRHCDWDELTELIAQGWEAASHSCSHRSMVSLRSEWIEREANESKRLLEDRLQIPVCHFVYPFGMRNDRTDSAVRRAGFDTLSGFFRTSAPDWVVRRPVYSLDTESSLRRKWENHLGESLKEHFIHFWSHASAGLQSLWVSPWKA